MALPSCRRRGRVVLWTWKTEMRAEAAGLPGKRSGGFVPQPSFGLKERAAPKR